MTVVRMLADDLTGAVDSICSFATVHAPVPVFWDGRARPDVSGSFAVDTETREARERQAVAAIADWLPSLSMADIAIKKLDSLLRGHVATEIAACLKGGRFASIVVAPAFPAQGRVMRRGRQFVREGTNGGWQELSCDLDAELGVLGQLVQRADDGDAMVGSGIFLCDAESDADLERIVIAGRALTPPILWCGSAGLTRALAGARAIESGPVPTSPLLVVIGSDHPVSTAQVDALERHRPGIRVVVDSNPPHEPRQAIDTVAGHLDAGRSAALVFRIAPGSSRVAASSTISELLATAVEQLPRPGSVLIVGGDTLFRFVNSVAASSLAVSGELLPGVPVSQLEGGRWDGLTVISKSGAFGGSDALCLLLDRIEDIDHAVS